MNDIKTIRDELNEILKDPKLLKDTDIQRALTSGEMHNGFVMMRRYQMDAKAITSYHQDLKKDEDYYQRLTDVNRKIAMYGEAFRKHMQNVAIESIKNGKSKYSELQLRLFGFDPEFAKKHAKIEEIKK
jgi:predicted phage tail protein